MSERLVPNNEAPIQEIQSRAMNVTQSILAEKGIKANVRVSLVTADRNKQISWENSITVGFCEQTTDSAPSLYGITIDNYMGTPADEAHLESLIQQNIETIRSKFHV